jgi:4-hydroxy-tetrahydrodipicolinate reductase
MTGDAPEVRIGVAGAAGRMGTAIVRLLASAPGVRLGSALVRAGGGAEGRDAGALADARPQGVVATTHIASFIAAADVLIDVSTGAARPLARAARRGGRPLVVGASGLDAAAEAELATTSKRVPVVRVANGSLGIAILDLLVKRAAVALGDSFDAEIVEFHHRRKIDSPSGTALAIGATLARARGLRLHDVAVRGRDGHTGRRTRWVFPRSAAATRRSSIARSFWATARRSCFSTEASAARCSPRA